VITANPPRKRDLTISVCIYLRIEFSLILWAPSRKSSQLADTKKPHLAVTYSSNIRKFKTVKLSHYTPWRCIGGREVQFRLFLTSALGRGKCPTPAKKHRYSSHRILNGTQGRSGCLGEKKRKFPCLYRHSNGGWSSP